MNLCNVPSNFGHFIECQLFSHQTAKTSFGYKKIAFFHSVFLVCSNRERYIKQTNKSRREKSYYYCLQNSLIGVSQTDLETTGHSFLWENWVLDLGCCASTLMAEAELPWAKAKGIWEHTFVPVFHRDLGSVALLCNRAQWALSYRHVIAESENSSNSQKLFKPGFKCVSNIRNENWVSQLWICRTFFQQIQLHMNQEHCSPLLTCSFEDYLIVQGNVNHSWGTKNIGDMLQCFPLGFKCLSAIRFSLPL